MKRSFRWVLRIFVVLLLLLVAALLFMDLILRSVAERRLRQAAGVEVKIGQLRVSLFSARVSVKDFQMSNPSGFGGGVLLSMPELSCAVDLRQAKTNRLHLNKLKLHLAELNVNRNRDGVINVQTVKDAILKNAKWDFQFGGIDAMELTLEKVNYIDQRQPGNDLHFDLGLKRET